MFRRSFRQNRSESFKKLYRMAELYDLQCLGLEQ